MTEPKGVRFVVAADDYRFAVWCKERGIDWKRPISAGVYYVRQRRHVDAVEVMPHDRIIDLGGSLALLAALRRKQDLHGGPAWKCEGCGETRLRARYGGPVAGENDIDSPCVACAVEKLSGGDA